MSEATRKLNQFEAGIERIEDPYTREAIQNLFALVQSLNSDGLHTNGKIACKDIFTKSGFRTDEGAVEATSLNIADGGVFRTKVFVGTLANGASTTIAAPSGIVLGFVGWTETTTAVSGVHVWSPIMTTITATRIYLRTASGTETASERIQIYNGTGATRPYRGVLFYKETSE